METIHSKNIPDGMTGHEYINIVYGNARIWMTYSSESRRKVRACAQQNGHRVCGWYKTGYGLWCAIIKD